MPGVPFELYWSRAPRTLVPCSAFRVLCLVFPSLCFLITGPGARVGERLSFARVVHCSFNRSTIAHHWLRVSEAVPLPDTRFYEMHANLATAVGVAVSVLSTEMLKLPSAGLANDHYMRVVSILMRSTSCEFYGGYLYSRRKIMLPTNQGIRRLRV